MTVPARPAAGGVVESGWGQVVHEAVVAQDVQLGTATVKVDDATSGGVRVTFPRPFAAVPVVLVSQAAQSQGWIAYTGSHDATGFTAFATTKAGNEASATIPVAWIAIGPRS